MRLSLICVLFDPTIPTSFFNFIQLFLYLCILYAHHSASYELNIIPLHDYSDIKYSCYSIPGCPTVQYCSKYPKLDKLAILILPS